MVVLLALLLQALAPRNMLGPSGPSTVEEAAAKYERFGELFKSGSFVAFRLQDAAPEAKRAPAARRSA